MTKPLPMNPMILIKVINFEKSVDTRISRIVATACPIVLLLLERENNHSDTLVEVIR